MAERAHGWTAVSGTPRWKFSIAGAALRSESLQHHVYEILMQLFTISSLTSDSTGIVKVMHSVMLPKDPSHFYM